MMKKFCVYQIKRRLRAATSLLPEEVDQEKWGFACKNE